MKVLRRLRHAALSLGLGVLLPALASAVPQAGVGATVVAWGNGAGYGLPANTPGQYWIDHIVGGGKAHFLRSDGTVVVVGGGAGWSAPPAPPAGLAYTRLFGGGSAAFALRTDGMLSAWGVSGTAITTGIPVPAPGVVYRQVSTLGLHALGRLSNGLISAWGLNNYGQTVVPTLPPGTTCLQVAAGLRHSMARLNNGTIIAWGDNIQGQCNVPQLSAGLTYTDVAATNFGSFALVSDGTARAWGILASGVAVAPTAAAGRAWIDVEGGENTAFFTDSAYELTGIGNGSFGGLAAPPLSPTQSYTRVRMVDHKAYALRIDDCDKDGISNPAELAGGAPDCNRDGVQDNCNLAAGAPDVNADGVIDICAQDCNANGLPDTSENFGVDCNSNWNADICDLVAGATDCDGNRNLDSCDIAYGATDQNNDGVIDLCLVDCNSNGLVDLAEINGGSAADCNHNSAIDLCEIAAGLADCDQDGVPNTCELAAGATDCNHNNLPDSCEIAAGAADCDSDLLLDACELPGNDCNANGRLDSCDIALGAADCDNDLEPDSCEIASGEIDCDSDLVLDLCELAAGAADCNGNTRLDSCEIAAGATDQNNDGVIDLCLLDCDNDGVNDATQVALGAGADCNGNAVLDACDIAAGGFDLNGNGYIDSCESDVVVVAPSGGDYTSIQAAIDAALDGNTVLVRPGANYAGFQVLNRAVRVLADSSAPIVLSGSIQVRNLGAGKLCVIDGFRATGSTTSNTLTDWHGLYVDACSGAVRVQDCVFRSAGASIALCMQTAAISITNSTDVVLVDTTGESLASAGGPRMRGAGLATRSARVAAFGCSFIGSEAVGQMTCAGSDCVRPGCSDEWWYGCDGAFGGPGVDAGTGTVAYLDNCSAQGGDAGSPGPNCPYPCYSGDGGDGLFLRSGAQVTTIGGVRAGGGASCFNASNGLPELVMPGATYVHYNQPARRLSMANPLREGTTAALSFTGAAGDSVYLAMTRSTQLAWMPLYTSVMVFGPAVAPRMLIVGSIPASGTLNYSMAVPPILPQSRTMCFQAFLRDTNGAFHCGTPKLVTVLDAGY